MKNINEKYIELNKLRNKALFSGCVHQDNSCDKTISRAHSIQNNKVLDKLSRNGKVMAFDFAKLTSGEFKFHEVGRGKASTFTGFCNHHDSIIFRAIEHLDYITTSLEQNYLFAYRAFALGYYERYSAFRLLEAKIDEDPNLLHSQSGERYFLYIDHLKLIEKFKIIMNSNLDNKRYDRISTELIIWPYEYGIASTSMFFIEYDNEGKLINDSKKYMSPFFFTIFPQEGKTYILMSYFTKDKAMYQFLKQQIVNTSEDVQKLTISNLLAMYIENIFISPDYWNRIPQAIREKYYHISQSTAGRKKPSRLLSFKDFNIFL